MPKAQVNTTLTKIKACFIRRNLVLNNLYDNEYISKKDLEFFFKQDIKLNKKKNLSRNSRIFVEDVRKSIVEKYGFDKVYKQGFNIKTPLDLRLQKHATASLRYGLEQYDKEEAGEDLWII